MSIDAIQRTTFNAVVGRLLAHHRDRVGMEQSELAEQLGMSQPNLSRIERGEANVSLQFLTRVATILGMPVAELVDQTEEARAGLEAMGVEVLWDKPIKKGDVALALLTGAALGYLIFQAIKN